jgi:hypothetical protein
VLTVKLKTARRVTLSLGVRPTRGLIKRLGRRPRLAFALEVLDRADDRATKTVHVRARR